MTLPMAVPPAEMAFTSFVVVVELSWPTATV
jgi:hypothetical protein